MSWKRFPQYWPSVEGIHGPIKHSIHKGPVSGTLMFSLLLTWTSNCTISWMVDYLCRHEAHVTIIVTIIRTNLLNVFEITTLTFGQASLYCPGPHWGDRQPSASPWCDYVYSKTCYSIELGNKIIHRQDTFKHECCQLSDDTEWLTRL